MATINATIREVTHSTSARGTAITRVELALGHPEGRVVYHYFGGPYATAARERYDRYRRGRKVGVIMRGNEVGLVVRPVSTRRLRAAHILRRAADVLELTA